MPITSTSFVRLTAGLKLIGLAALLCIVGATIWLVERAHDNFDTVVRAQTMRAAAVELRNGLQDVEAGQRGYLLTLDEAYLEPYEEARGRVLPALDQLVGLVSENAWETGSLEDLRVAVLGKLAELDQTIALARQGRQADALELVRSDTGKTYMDLARERLDDVIAEAGRRLTAGVEQQRDEAATLRWVAVIGGILIVLVVGTSTWVALTYTRELLQARAELEEANAGLEERVAERTADLAQANEEVQRFAYIVTHDLRAPLVNIMGFTSELEANIATIRDYMDSQEAAAADADAQAARLAATEDLPEAIGFIRSSTRKMDGLINAILKLSREGYRPVKPEPIELGSFVGSAAASVQHQIDERNGSIDIDPDLPAVVTDRLALEQIFGNLLDNAVKYSDPTRPLRIRIANAPAQRGRVALDIEDNGRGIAEQDHQRVFELFRRSGDQKATPGEGIGLAHVRTLVRNLGGDITLTSTLGKGTTFRVTLARDLREFTGRRRT